MQRRTGLTLVEVLVAIFIMGIGLIALLTLFPIGILRIAQAIRDERTAQAAGAAHAYSKLLNIRNDPVVLSDGVVPDLFVNPLPATLSPADPCSESYPVYVDPVGFLSGNGDWVGGIPGYLRRRPVSASAVPDLNSTIRSFKVWDDITFDSVFDPSAGSLAPGTPKALNAATPPTIQRDPVYSWAYLFRRPQTQDRSVVDCAIVVYDKRPTISPGETVFQAGVNGAYFDPVQNLIYLDISAGAPNIRAGDWLYDATLYQTPPSNGSARASAHSYFYRVVAAEDLPGTGIFAGKTFAKYEVQTPIRGYISGPSLNRIAPTADPTTGAANSVYPGTVIVMERVVEVFEKGPFRLP